MGNSPRMLTKTGQRFEEQGWDNPRRAFVDPHARGLDISTFDVFKIKNEFEFLSYP